MLPGLVESNRGVGVATLLFFGFADRVHVAKTNQGHGFWTLAAPEARGSTTRSGSAKSSVIS